MAQVGNKQGDGARIKVVVEWPKDLNNESWIKSIWSGLVPLLPTLSSLVRKSVYTPVQISIFYAAAPTGKRSSIITQALLSHTNPPTPPTPPSSMADSLPLGLTLTPESWPSKLS